MTDGGVGQVVDTTGEVELQVKLGNVQAGVDSRHSVLALSCKYELVLVGRSINGSSLGHRHERFLLLAHLAQSQCQRETNSSEPRSCRLQAARPSHLPWPLLPDMGRREFRYKRDLFHNGLGQNEDGYKTASHFLQALLRQPSDDPFGAYTSFLKRLEFFISQK